MSKRFSSLIVAAVLVFVCSATARAELFTAYLAGEQEVPAVAATATGYARIVLNESAGTVTFTVVFSGLSSNQTASHIHLGAAIGATAPVAINFGAVGGTSGTISGTASITPTQISQLRAHLGYVNVHSANFPNGEIRGQIGIKRPVDFDGDGKQDFSVLRFPTIAPPGVAQATFWNQNTTGGNQIAQWGDANTDFPVPGDYDGDGRDDLAVYRAGATAGAQSSFFVYRSSNNTVQVENWGLNGDQAICRDYDGDGKTDFAVFRRGAAPGAQAYWWIIKSSTGLRSAAAWGTTGDTVAGTGDEPVPGDYDGDGKFDLAVYRHGGLSPNNTFIILRSSDSQITYQQWGDFNSDYIAPGDYDGDGKFDFCAVRTGATSSSPMLWQILQSSNGQIKYNTFGFSSDTIVQGDYDGDARTDIAIYRQGATAGANSNFWILRSFDNTVRVNSWGLRGDFAVASFDAR